MADGIVTDFLAEHDDSRPGTRPPPFNGKRAPILRPGPPPAPGERDILDPVLFSLKKRREELKLSQATLAAQIGVPMQSLIDWELGNYSPTLRTLRLWAHALDGYLLFVADE